MKKTIFFIIVFGIVHSVFPQKKDSTLVQDPHKLDEIIIQNERIQIPYSKQNRDISIIDSTLIKSMPVNSISDVLSYVSGIDMRRRGAMGNQADISINGGTFDQTLVLINGMKMSDPQTGHNMMNLPINLNDVQRIEILKGSAASIYGVNAINGAINIITQHPDKTGVTAHIYTGSSFKKDTASNRLYSGLGTEFSAMLATDNTQHFLSAGLIKSNGHRYNTGINNKKIFYTNQIDLGKQNWLKTMGGLVRNDFGAHGFYSAPQDTEASDKIETAIGSIEGKFKLSKIWTFKPGFDYRYSDDHYLLDRHHPEIYENQHYNNVFNTKLNNSFHTQIGTIGFGLEWRNEKISSNSLGHHSRNNLGFFGNYNLDFIRRVTTNLGLYANYNKDSGWDWMPSIDVGYQLQKNLRLYANAGTGMRLPTYTDLYYNSPTNMGNEDLQPEKAQETAIGLKYHKSFLEVSAEYFYRNTDNFIDWVKDKPEDPWETLNYQNIKTRGLSFKTTYQLIPDNYNTGNSLETQIAYTYLNPKIKKAHSDKLSNYALENLEHQFSTRLNFQLLTHVHFTLSGKYEKRVSYKDYFLLAARLSVALNQFEIHLDGDNLTNRAYTEAGAVPMPGRWINLGIKWQWWK